MSVCSPVVTALSRQPPPSDQCAAPNESAESASALRFAEAALEQAAVPFTAHAEVGHLGETIAQRADDLGCDLIVMGAHGRGALADLLVGSTATKVIHLARVPVLLVK